MNSPNKRHGLMHLLKVQEIWDEYVSEVFERSEHKLDLAQFNKFIYKILEEPTNSTHLDNRIRVVFNNLDINNDGYISFFEFIRIVSPDGEIKIKGINA